MYFRSERISGESLKKNVHRMKSIWTKFQSFTDADRKRWKDDHRLAELNHNNLLKSQNGISPKNGGQKRPSNSLDLYVANYKTMAPSAKRQTIIRDWNKLSNRSVWDNLVDERRQMSLKYYEDDEDEPTEVAAAATLPSLSAVPATAPNDTVGESSKALWDLQMILKPHLINRPNAKKCDEDECTLVACVKWTSDHKSNKPWFGCLGKLL